MKGAIGLILCQHCEVVARATLAAVLPLSLSYRLAARAMFRVAARVATRHGARRTLSGGSNTSRNNLLVAGGLCIFTGGVYYQAMNKMSKTDDIAELELEGKINVHESGLKVTRPRSIHGALQPTDRESK